jgi:cell division protein FtsX
VIEKLKFFLSVTGNNLWQFRTRNIFSVTIICLSFLTVGIFMSLANNLRATAKELSRNMTIAFYLDKGLSAAAVEAVRQEIGQPGFVESVRVVTPDEALERFRASFPELADIVSGLETNPFPTSIEMRVNARPRRRRNRRARRDEGPQGITTSSSTRTGWRRCRGSAGWPGPSGRSWAAS